MRLFELEDRFGNELAMILRNMLGRANSKHTSMKLSYAAISNMARNVGYGPVSFESFNNLYDSTPAIQQVVSDYDENGVTLGTTVDTGSDAEAEEPGNSPTVKQAARSGNPYT